jgi:hypothetical protein
MSIDAVAFPLSEDPVMITPAIARPTGVSTCKVLALAANCSSYGQVTSAPLVLPAECPGPYSKIVLDFVATEKGVQYDRSARTNTALYFGACLSDGCPDAFL